MNVNTETVKIVVGIVAQLGAGAITASIVRNNVPTRNLITAITVPVAGACFGGIAAGACKQHSDQVIDEVADFLTSFKNSTTS